MCSSLGLCGFKTSPTHLLWLDVLVSVGFPCLSLMSDEIMLYFTPYICFDNKHETLWRSFGLAPVYFYGHWNCRICKQNILLRASAWIASNTTRTVVLILVLSIGGARINNINQSSLCLLLRKVNNQKHFDQVAVMFLYYQETTEPMETHFLLADSVYCKASVPPTDKVCLWLGVSIAPSKVFHHKSMS